MDLINLLKLAGLAVHSPAANAEVEEDVPGKANTKPDPQIFPDGPSNLGSVSDTSLRRYLKARGQPVSVDETTYPDYSIDDVLESYEAYTAEKAKNPYAIGMASAMKTTGDKPPLKKSTINKAHKIAKGIDEASDEAMPSTYAAIEYDYSEDFGMITLYKNGEKIEHWNGYFGANTVGNPLADKFVELAMKHNLNPEGMSITDDTGATGTFRNNTFNWDQFAKDETGMNESINESYISELTRVLKNSGQLLNEAGGIGGGISGGKFGMPKGNFGLPNVAKALGDIMPQLRQTTGSDNLMRQPTAPAGGGIKGLERAPWSPGDSGAPGDVAIRKVKPDWDNGSIAQSIQRIKKFDPTPAASVDRDRQGPGNVGTDVRNVDRDRQGPGNVGFSKPSYGPGTVSPGSMPADPDFGKKGRGLAPNTPRVGGKSATITPPVSRPNLIRPPRPNVGGARPEGPAAGMPKARSYGDTPVGSLPAAEPSYGPGTVKPGSMPKAPPQPASFKDAFRAARKAAGGAGGVFMWNGKPYQTNIKGEPAQAWNSKDLKKVGNWSASESTNEASKPDFLDMDKDGNKKEPMKKALKDKEKVSESISYLKRLAGL